MSKYLSYSVFLLSIIIMQVFVVITSSTLLHAVNTTNLITNPGLESSKTGTNPDAWTSSSWGDNTADFVYSSDAHSGFFAAQTTISNYVSGDAKWQTDLIPVTSGSTYHYSDWYKSTALTYVWAQSLKTDGTYQYSLLKQAVASPATWIQTSVDITIDNTTQSMRIFHVIASDGTLSIDDTVFNSVVDCDQNIVNGLTNGGFESTCPLVNGAPDGWTEFASGSSNGSFAISTKSHTGSYATTIANNVSGAEAGLSTTIASVSSNQRYTLSFWQSGDIYVYAYIAYTLTNGTTQYQSLMAAPATLGEWSLYNDSFVTPANIAKTQLFIATSGVGAISVDDIALATRTNQLPATFATGMVSVTFDDGTKTSYQNGLPVLKQYGYKGTFYVNAGSLDTSGFMTSTQVKALAANGQEIGSHLYHHSDMVQLDTLTLQSELSGNRASLQSVLGTQYTISSFASPYGSFTSNRIDTVMDYASSHRDTDGEYNTKANLDPRQIHAKLVMSTTTLVTIQSWITEAKNNKSWLVLVYHDIASSTTNQSSDVAPYNVTPANFKKQVAAVNASGLPVNTISAALNALSSQ
jgi:peptidoglycan/xylan/chitin deacetylase (PgdA/CDA1 family)